MHGNNENHDIAVIDDVSKPAESVKALTAWEHDDIRPVWSPDGRQIAFMSDAGNNKDIYIMNADGSNLRRLTYEKSAEGYPAWRP